jgi:hypothetical protein
MRRLLTGGFGLLFAAFAIATGLRAETVSCTFKMAGSEFKGTCLIPCSVNALAIEFDGINPKRACSGPPRTVDASIAPGKGADWLGKMQGKEPDSPTRFEIRTGQGSAPSVAKLPFGWFRVAQDSRTVDTWVLELDASRQMPPTDDDLRILKRAKALLATEAVWNKEDTRQCPPEQTKTSLFCALQRSTTEVSGGVHYRQPALQAVREVLNEVGVARFKSHRIMDYNNHPDTTLAEIHALLDKAHERIAARVAK